MIYRRIDDLFLDPEAFRPDSALGVPGPAAGVEGRQRRPRQRARRRRGRRQGRVRLGARHHPLLPRRGAAHPERADLPLPDAPTSAQFVHRQHRRPGGEAGQRERRLRPAHRQPARRPRSGPTGIAAIEADPRNWVAQPILDLSVAPTLTDDGIEPRHLDLRPFILTGRTSYVTKGGLTRVALPEGLARGELARRAAAARTPGSWSSARPMLLSRVAENLYWAGRYLERAEDTARIVREHTNLHRRPARRGAPVTWEPLLAVIGDAGRVRRALRSAPTRRSILRYLVADPEHPGSILRSVEQAREDLRTTREVLPREAWQAVNDLYLYVASQPHRRRGPAQPQPVPRAGHRRVPADRRHPHAAPCAATRRGTSGGSACRSSGPT